MARNRPQSRRNSPASRGSSQIRLISGRWRGRKLSFPEIQGLRPTHDRIRETLFNWLTPVLRDAECLDLFAGSGALGFEALSRGAASCTLIESDAAAIACLQDSRSRLEADDAEIHRADALTWLRAQQDRQWDLVFMDPPYHQDLISKALNCLRDLSAVRPGGYVYIEMENESTVDFPGWKLHRHKETRSLRYALLQAVQAAGPASDA